MRDSLRIESTYQTLERSSQCWRGFRHNPYSWLNYFWDVMLRVCRKFGERIGEVRSGRDG
jgi:hypothetical protein